MADVNDDAEGRRSTESLAAEVALDAAEVAALYEAHARDLRVFVLGVTRDPDVTGDVLQATFAKVVELGHRVRTESFRGWLFRVAFHEALVVRRRRQARDQGIRRFAARGHPAGELPEDPVIRDEVVEAVRVALAGLPVERRRVVRARIYENKTFAEIAKEDGLPLGTVLTRMRLALEELRRTLRPGE